MGYPQCFKNRNFAINLNIVGIKTKSLTFYFLLSGNNQVLRSVQASGSWVYEGVPILWRRNWICPKIVLSFSNLAKTVTNVYVKHLEAIKLKQAAMTQRKNGSSSYKRVHCSIPALCRRVLGETLHPLRWHSHWCRAGGEWLVVIGGAVGAHSQPRCRQHPPGQLWRRTKLTATGVWMRICMNTVSIVNVLSVQLSEKNTK